MKKIPGVSRLLFCICLCLGRVSLAQAEGNVMLAQDQSQSTVDLEAQPNTNQYPVGPPRRHRPGQPNPQPSPTPSDLDPSANANPSNNNTAQPNSGSQPAPNSQIRPVPPASPAAKLAVAPPKRVLKSEGDTANRQPFIPQGQGMIGPPAPVPPTPEQMPPAPAKVSFENGLLSVDSTNARLSDILNAIRAKTGIQFEGLPAAQDRVAGKFGPAPSDQVLTSLLQGLHYDYVIIGTPENPSLVQRVILTPTAGASTVAANPGAQAAQDNNGDDDDSSNDDTSAETPEQAQQPGQPIHPQVMQGPKSPEQLLEELKKMQQRSQEQNQQQNQEQNQQPNQQQNQPQNPPSQPPTPE